MQNEKFIKRNDIAELIDFNTDEFLCEVQEKLDIWGIPMLDNIEQMKEIIHNSIEIDLEEIESEKDQTRSIYIKRDGSGKFYSIRNMRFCLLDFIEGILTLITSDQYRLIVGVCFLCKIMKQMGVDLEESQVAICVALHIETKLYAVTDENLIQAIINGLSESSYCEIYEEDISKDLKKLLELGIIEIENGRYTVTQKLYFV